MDNRHGDQTLKMDRERRKSRTYWIAAQVVALIFIAAAALLRAEQVSELRVWHRAGQTFLTWKEVNNPITRDPVFFQELKNVQTRIEQEQRRRYKIYRSTRPIHSTGGLKAIAEVPPFSGWNMDYYGTAPKPEIRAFRYVVEEGN